MEIVVLDDVGAEHVVRIRELVDRVSAHDDHAALGEHKSLDLSDGDGSGFVSVLATDGADLVGYAHLSRHGPRWGLELVVDPGVRGGDVEIALARHALEAARERGGGQLSLWVFKPDEVHDDLAERLGLRRGRELLHMRVPLPIDAELVVLEGVTIRGFEPGRDEDAWVAVNNEAFADHPEQGDWDRAMLERRMREPWFDPSGFLLATIDGRLVGSNWMKPYRDAGEGEIHVIGVAPSQQGSGLGRTLAIAGLHWAAEQGLHTGTLYTESEAAIAMYRSLGFEADHTDRAYVTEVPRA